MIKRWGTHLPLMVLHGILLMVFTANFHSGNMFIGWDSINSELNVNLNLERALYSGWQEYYGVGLIGGHGFAALAPHALMIKFLSYVVPQWAVRTIWTFLALYVGTIGMYLLVRHLVNSLKRVHAHHPPWLALLGALSYLFNLATIQQIYTQTEAFTFHFMSLPWLYIAVFLLLQKMNIRSVAVFVIINLVASGQGFVPPIFVAYLGSLFLFLFSYAVYHRFARIVIVKILLILTLTLCANAYWLGPFTYYTLTGKQTEFVNSYNNRIQTVEFVEKSKKYGNIADVALIKGFFWDAQDGEKYILQAWINHTESLPIRAYGYLVFIIGIVGLVSALIKKEYSFIKPFAFVYLYFFGNVAIDTPPFSYVIALIRENSSLFEQVFRNTFTKFSIGLGFCYSIFFVIGLLFLTRFLANVRISFQRFTQAFFIVCVVCAIVYGLPAMQGHLFYEKLHVKVPQQYIDLIHYFKDQSDGRIADFPQNCPEGWYSYNWGYFGSGFLWYGIRQPFLSRTFDVWSKHNETYYWEISNALQQQDIEKVESVLKKYDVRWIVYDPNIQHCKNQNVFFKQEDVLKTLANSKEYSVIKTFKGDSWAPLFLYQATNPLSASYVSVQKSNKNIRLSPWVDRDAAYEKAASYISDEARAWDETYPYTGLFTKRGQADSAIDIAHEDASITFTAPQALSGFNAHSTLLFDSPYIAEKVIPAELYLRPALNNPAHTNVLLNLTPPKIYFDGKVVYDGDLTLSIGELPEKISIEDVTVRTHIYEGEPFGEYIGLPLLTQGENIITVRKKNDDKAGTLLVYKTGVLASTSSKMVSVDLQGPQSASLVVEAKRIPQLSYGLNPQLSQIYPTPCSFKSGTTYKAPSGNDGYIRMIDNNSRSCLKISFDSLETALGYSVRIKVKHVSGLPLNVEIINPDQGVIAYTSLSTQTDDWATYSHFISPGAPYDLGYELHLINSSYNYHNSVNDISDIDFAYVPADFMYSIHLQSSSFASSLSDTNRADTHYVVSHPHEYLYKVQNVKVDDNSLLVLSQSFDEGWILIPESKNIIEALLSNKTDHALVDGWKNGWHITKDKGQEATSYTIVYWPQFLEFMGFFAVGCVFVLLYFVFVFGKGAIHV